MTEPTAPNVPPAQAIATAERALIAAQAELDKSEGVYEASLEKHKAAEDGMREALKGFADAYGKYMPKPAKTTPAKKEKAEPKPDAKPAMTQAPLTDG